MKAEWKKHPLFDLTKDVCPMCGSRAPVHTLETEDGYMLTNRCRKCKYECEISDYPRFVEREKAGV